MQAFERVMAHLEREGSVKNDRQALVIFGEPTWRAKRGSLDRTRIEGADNVAKTAQKWRTRARTAISSTVSI